MSGHSSSLGVVRRPTGWVSFAWIGVAFGGGDSGLTDLHCAKNAFGTSGSTPLVPFCTAQPTPPGGGREERKEFIKFSFLPSPFLLALLPFPLFPADSLFFLRFCYRYPPPFPPLPLLLASCSFELRAFIFFLLPLFPFPSFSVHGNTNMY